MTGTLKYIGLVAGMVLLTVSSTWAQQAEDQYLGLDVFGGFLTAVDPREGGPSSDSKGWEAGATVFVASRWFGVTGSLGRTTGADGTLYHYLVGPRATTSYGHMGTRAFAHVLVGAARVRGEEGRMMHRSELVAGGGLDTIGVLRLQFDYVRFEVPGLERNDLRVFLGGVVPLCFRQCRDSDGFPVGKQMR